MKKQLVCPVCGFKRLVDADQNTRSELCEESQIKPGGDRIIMRNVKNAESR